MICTEFFDLVYQLECKFHAFEKEKKNSVYSVWTCKLHTGMFAQGVCFDGTFTRYPIMQGLVEVLHCFFGRKTCHYSWRNLTPVGVWTGILGIVEM